MRSTGYKDLDKFQKTKARQKKRYYKKTQSAPKSGQPWTKEELLLVITFEGTDTELADILGRSVMAIQKQRQKYKQSQVTTN